LIKNGYGMLTAVNYLVELLHYVIKSKFSLCYYP